MKVFRTMENPNCRIQDQVLMDQDGKDEESEFIDRTVSKLRRGLSVNYDRDKL